MAVNHLFVSAKSDGGDATLVQPGDWNDAHVVGAATVSRTMLDATGKNWQFLGSATLASNNVTCGPVVWTGSFQQLEVWYIIAGYTGSAIARLLTGDGSISTTALNNGSRLREGIAVETTAPSIPGFPLATTVSNIARGGRMWIDGLSGTLKRIRCSGHNGNPSVTTPPTLFEGTSFFSDLGSNLLLHRAQLTSYDTLTATAASGSIVLTTGTYLAVFGRNTD